MKADSRRRARNFRPTPFDLKNWSLDDTTHLMNLSNGAQTHLSPVAVAPDLVGSRAALVGQPCFASRVDQLTNILIMGEAIVIEQLHARGVASGGGFRLTVDAPTGTSLLRLCFQPLRHHSWGRDGMRFPTRAGLFCIGLWRSPPARGQWSSPPTTGSGARQHTQASPPRRGH